MTSTPAGQPDLIQRDLDKASRCGEPSYVWGDGQQRRLDMILDAAGSRVFGSVLENGCGVGVYLDRLSPSAGMAVGLEYDLDRARQAQIKTSIHPGAAITCAAGEALPFQSSSFDLILSHEVLEHVQDDRLAVQEIVRTLKPMGRAVIFVPNRAYPFETHGVFWRGRYHFGNIALVNYLPHTIRDRLAPHVRIYSPKDLDALFNGLAVRIVRRQIIFGAYDNIIARRPRLGKALRKTLHFLEKTPLKSLVYHIFG